VTARAEQSASHKISDRARLSPAALAARGVGNLLEWYDFGVYGYFAPVLARLFFPSDDPLASLIGAYGGFAVGFAVGFANAAYWCCGSWNHRRPRRTALRAAAVGDADGRRHDRDRAAADL
jgi:MFS family permease